MEAQDQSFILWTGAYRIAHLQALLSNFLTGVFDLLLSSEEDEDVSGLLVHVDLHHRPDCCLQVVPFRLLSVEDLHWMESSGNFHQWCIQEVTLELLCLERGTHDHQLQVLPLLQHLRR